MNLRGLQINHPTASALILVFLAAAALWIIVNSFVDAYPEQPSLNAHQTAQPSNVETAAQLRYPDRFEP